MSIKSTIQSTASKVLDSIETLTSSDLLNSSFTNPIEKIAKSLAVGFQKINMDLEENIVTLDQIHKAHSFLRDSAEVVRTPVLSHMQDLFTDNSGNTFKDIDIYMKMENMQTTGSFKIRGVVNQMHKVTERHGDDCRLITMSAGNYGKAFAHCVGRRSAKSVCVMPHTAPQQRASLIQGMGVEVVKVEPSDIQLEVGKRVKEDGFIYCHPFDDVDLIAGYGSCALEFLEECPDPDIVLVCCGGGGLVAGIAAAVSLAGVKGCRVYAVEPEKACTMYESFQNRRPMTIPTAKSIAAGLAPPFAGSLCYKHCRWFVEDVLLVSEDEILAALRQLWGRGVKVEPSGAAAFAALMHGKVPDIKNKKVVVCVTGGNVSTAELNNLIPDS